jgi:hypothetical protein
MNNKIIKIKKKKKEMEQWPLPAWCRTLARADQ